MNSVKIAICFLFLLMRLSLGWTSQLSDAANCFTLNLYKNLASSQPNLIVSPFSADILLSLLLTAADGTTFSQLNNALGYADQNLALSDMKNAFKSALASLVSSNGNTLTLASSIWVRNGFSVEPEFISTAGNFFGVNWGGNLDFGGDPHGATETINSWANSNTNGLIEKIFDQDLSPNTAMVLANALYFKGFWEKMFKTENTVDGPFYNNGEDSQSSVVPFMNQLQYFDYKYDSAIKAKILKMNYKGKDTSMVIVLPDSTTDLQTVEQNLNCQSFPNIWLNLKNSTVQVRMPKFTQPSDLTLTLKPSLQAIGVTDLFDANKASLPGLASGVYVDYISQKAVISVSEEGSEAAAVTVIGVCTRSGSNCEDPENLVQSFRLERPFSYLILHKPSGMILFMGRITSF